MRRFLGLDFTVEQVPDATIIAAPSSTKNADGARDPEMRQALKGNQWYFGMKAHIGVDAGAGYVHSVTATTASVHDLDQVARLVRADDMAKNLNHLGVLFASANWVMHARAGALMG